MSRRIFDFEVLEDNGGGLHLFVFDCHRNIFYANCDYEYRDDALLFSHCLDLMDGANPDEEGWESVLEEKYNIGFDEDYLSFDDESKNNGGWDYIADEKGLYPRNMGNNAADEFFDILPEEEKERILQEDFISWGDFIKLF